MSKSETIAAQIRARMEAKQLSVAALERLAGLRMNAVRNILRGQSKKPSAEHLQAIAEALGCSVRDLLKGTVSNIPAPVTLHYPALLLQAMKVVLNILEEKKYTYTVDQVMGVVKEVYLFACEKTPQQVDKQFAAWFIERQVNTQD